MGKKRKKSKPLTRWQLIWRWFTRRPNYADRGGNGGNGGGNGG